MGLPPLTIAEADGWREGLTRWYRAVLDVYAAHPWILDIPIVGEPNTPNNLAWLDSGLEVLAASPLDAESRVSAVLLLSGHSRWEAQVARRDVRSGDATPTPGVLAALITPEQFPHLYPAIRDGAFASDDNPFEFGLSRILDGLDHYMAEVARGGQGAAPVPLDPDRQFAHDERVKKARQAVKDAEGRLRDARKKEREAVAKARERAAQ
jgi:hypothetical protein